MITKLNWGRWLNWRVAWKKTYAKQYHLGEPNLYFWIRRDDGNAKSISLISEKDGSAHLQRLCGHGHFQRVKTFQRSIVLGYFLSLFYRVVMIVICFSIIQISECIDMDGEAISHIPCLPWLVAVKEVVWNCWSLWAICYHVNTDKAS